MKKAYLNFGGLLGIGGALIGFIIAISVLDIGKSNNKSSQTYSTNTLKLNEINDEINEDNLILDLRKPIVIEFKERGTSSVYLYPTKSCKIILPNHTTLKLNPKYIREIRLSPYSTVEKTGIVNGINIRYNNDMNFDDLVFELKNINLTLKGNTDIVDYWLKTRTKESMAGPSIDILKDYRVLVSVIDEQWRMGEKIGNAQIHYINFRLNKHYIDKITK